MERASRQRRVIVLVLAEIIAGMGRWLLRLATGGHGSELSEAIKLGLDQRLVGLLRHRSSGAGTRTSLTASPAGSRVADTHRA
ncbi:MAG TPA: hypothetical protein VKV28_17520 [Candidatus Binataceae bacterium]|nr:hypothetical protein [Candidatus Binataceae bacterium]